MASSSVEINNAKSTRRINIPLPHFEDVTSSYNFVALISLFHILKTPSYNSVASISSWKASPTCNSIFHSLFVYTLSVYLEQYSSKQFLWYWQRVVAFSLGILFSVFEEVGLWWLSAGGRYSTKQVLWKRPNSTTLSLATL